MSEEKKLEAVKPDYVAPERANIREELKKVSNFTDDELAVLNWSSLYKSHSLIVKYGQTGVEEGFRKEEWFQNEVKNYIANKPSQIEEKPKDKKDMTKEELKELKLKEKEAARLQKEKERLEKKEEIERKKRVKEVKEKFKDTEFKIYEFYGFLSDLAKSKERNFELTLIDKALIKVKRAGKPYFNIFADNGKIVFKRGEV
ncbi:MAG TPA: hypothetical protein PKY81_14650 [bacterium]|nr:hypothetical protein [bacterium]HPN32188.1 hypothetical protein [bacterium]